MDGTLFCPIAGRVDEWMKPGTNELFNRHDGGGGEGEREREESKTFNNFKLITRVRGCTKSRN